jgi:hypothetical protein
LPKISTTDGRRGERERVRPLFRGRPTLFVARAREQFRVDCREVKWSVGSPCLGNSEVRLLCQPAIGKSHVGILTSCRVLTINMVLLESFTLSFVICPRRRFWLLGQGLPLWGSSLVRREQQFVIALIPANFDARRRRSGLKGASGRVCLYIPSSLLLRGPQRGNSKVNIFKFFG